MQKRVIFAGLQGPGPVKISEFHADWYLVAADMSALPVAAATLEAMPEDAKGVAIIEILSGEDRQEIIAPKGIEMRWIVSPDPYHPSGKQEELIRGLQWPDGVVQTCIAGESGLIRSLRGFREQREGCGPGQYLYFRLLENWHD